MKTIAKQPFSTQLENIMTVSDLKMHFPITRGLMKHQVGSVKAVDGVSFTIKRGQTLGIVGESGSGKSTIGNCLIHRNIPTSGDIVFEGTNLKDVNAKTMRLMRRTMQMITQDPFASLDPRFTVGDCIAEGLRIHHLVSGKKAVDEKVKQMLEMVGLRPEVANRYPHEFSGGQRQRISIARSLALQPSFIVCDEIVSALDVSIQAQIVSLMMKLQQELGLTYVFIGHDLSVVRYISQNVAVLYLGKIMELTSSDELYDHPLHPYTKALISAAPIPDPVVDRSRERILLKGEIPSPINPPKGCNFCTRCPYATDRCREEEPAFVDVGNNHWVACHQVTGK
jgi:oligopeptide transport system ATP-binding protein